ncbi:MAG: NADH-quinone oxidoreductase subunit N [Acidobacteria bacterium]|nr:NADH-quinone oxidoreductase subunit N [Acidobacteriota bacterium]
MIATYLPLVPQLILITAGILVMLLEPFTAPGRKGRLGQMAVIASALAAYSLGFQWNSTPRTLFHGMFIVDNFTMFFQWLFLVITAIAALVSIRFNQREEIERGEYYALLLFACSGMSLMAASGDLILTFLAIEILSIATYVLAGFKRSDAHSNESALKYFLLGSFATAFLLYGIALIYGTSGSTNYQVIRDVGTLPGQVQVTAVAGLVLLLVGFGFKAALVPFHAWAPDVYQGAPTPVTAFMTVGPKAAAFAALLRILAQALPAMADDWTRLLWAVSILTMTLGNVVAVLQTDLKRMLAYSAIAHAGYLLIGVVTNTGNGFGAVLFYLVVYTVMNLGALTIVLSLSRQGDKRVNLEDYAGLSRSAPFIAASLSVFLISLAGIPLTGGFLGKFYLFSAAVEAGYIGLAVIGVLNSVVSVYYYFRVMVVMYMREAADNALPPEPISPPVLAIIAIGVAGILWLGVYPADILNLASNSALTLK